LNEEPRRQARRSQSESEVRAGPLRLRVVNPPAIADIVLRCVSDFELRDREGRNGRGFTNLKRILGRPSDFALVVGELARTVPAGHAVAARDERLPRGAPVHLVDDLVFSGQTLRSARQALEPVGLDGRTASTILWPHRADAADGGTGRRGMAEVTSPTRP
jgi:hypothetical protein